MSKINLLIERSRFAAGQHDIKLANEAEREFAAMQARIEKLEEVARVASFIELNRHNYLFNGRLEADKTSVYYMDLLKEKLEALKGEK